MKITSIDLQGFKSFLHKASFQFANNVSVIVGPNGCGKSNIVDAFKWVLADKSAKNLRCSTMEDVIFNGSKTQKAINLSQVTINFENSKIENRKFQNYRDIAITRKLFRSGESEYRINNTKCRLKDIEELLLELNLSGNSYNIISQDELGFLINAKPEERRAVIEDACGISKYRFQKKEIEKKIKGTRENLLRINDIFTEVSNQKSSLMVQAEKAKKFLEYKKQLEAISLFIAYTDYEKQERAYDKVHADFERERSLFLEEGLKFNESERFFTLREESTKKSERHFLDLQKESTRLSGALHSHESRVASYDSRWQVLRLHEDKLKEDLEHIRLDLEEKRQSEVAVQKVIDELLREYTEVKEHFDTYIAGVATRDNEIREIEEKESHCLRELQDKEKEIHTLHGIITLYRDQIRGIEEERIRKDSERSSKENDYQKIKEALLIIENNLSQKSSELSELEKSLGILEGEKVLIAKNVQLHEEVFLSLQKTYHEIEAKLKVTRDHSAHFSDYRESLHYVFTEHKDKVQASLLEHLDVSEEYIDIVSALLKDRLEYPIIQDLATGVELIEVVRKNNKGLVSMFIADESSSSEELIDPNDLGKLQCLRALVSIKDSSSPVRHVLANKYIAESASVAREMSRRYPHATFGTRDGIVFSEGCIVSGGSTNGDNVLLKRKNELEKFELKYSQTKTLYESASYELDTLRNTLSTKENEIRTLRDTIARCHSEVDTLQEDVHNKKAQALTFEREDELRQLWGRKAEEENIEKGKKVEEAQKHIETLTVEIATLKEHGDQYKKIIDELTREIESERQREKEYLVKKTSLEEKLKNSKEEVQKITTFLQTLLLREKEIQDRIEKGAHELTSVLNEKEAEEKALRELKETLASVQKEFEETEQKLADERVAFEELKKELEEKKQALEQKSQSTNALMLQKERLSMKRDMLTSDCQNKHGINIENYKPEVNMSYSGAKEEEKKLGLYLSKIGEVNVKAIKDYEEILVRFTFLESQKKDLENSLDELERALTKVNKNTVTLFTEAFEKVRINFQENIQKLFPNGSGDLYLSNPDNILESGIDLVIEPKGKSIRNINLLSGGEKALVLICYLISIFYYNPSPFCILDEIDAPLDDTNVDKFVNLVKSLTGKTQFLIISHNKKTMEMSEYLYGITMEEPGISKVVSVDFKGFELEGNA